MAKQTAEIPILDLYLAAFQQMKGNTPRLDIQGTRVVFFFMLDKQFQHLTERYNGNEAVPVLEYVTAVRQLRARMLALRGDR